MNTITAAPRRGAFPLIAALVLVLGACSSSSPSSNEGGGTVAVIDGAVTITAEELAFDASTIVATAGEAFTITLVNNDSAPHNISIYTEKDGDAIVQGEIINAGETVTVEVPAQEAGEYYFHCDVHPDMNGTLVVG